jgi:hypothetical protein
MFVNQEFLPAEVSVTRYFSSLNHYIATLFVINISLDNQYFSYSDKFDLGVFN